jgi:hypothetical protein
MGSGWVNGSVGILFGCWMGEWAAGLFCMVHAVMTMTLNYAMVLCSKRLAIACCIQSMVCVSHGAAGGLPDAVSALKEALVLPAKYGHLLAAAPLRLRTGEN